MDTFSFIISVMLVVFIATDLLAAALLFRGAARSSYSIIALNERALVATLQATSGLLLGILGANRIFEWHLPVEVVLVMLSVAVLLQALPSIVWLGLYFRHKFNNRGE